RSAPGSITAINLTGLPLPTVVSKSPATICGPRAGPPTGSMFLFLVRTSPSYCASRPTSFTASATLAPNGRLSSTCRRRHTTVTCRTNRACLMLTHEFRTFSKPERRPLRTAQLRNDADVHRDHADHRSSGDDGGLH